MKYLTEIDVYKRQLVSCVLKEFTQIGNIINKSEHNQVHNIIVHCNSVTSLELQLSLIHILTMLEYVRPLIQGTHCVRP